MLEGACGGYISRQTGWVRLSHKLCRPALYSHSSVCCKTVMQIYCWGEHRMTDTPVSAASAWHTAYLCCCAVLVSQGNQRFCSIKLQESTA